MEDNGVRMLGGELTPGRMLYDAIERNNLDAAFRLIHSGADVNYTDETGTTPLMLAALNGSIPLAAELLRNGARINYIRNGVTALTYAIGSDNIALVEFLVNKGADIKIGNPLQYAALINNFDMVKYLIKQKVDVNNNGVLNTPLTCALSIRNFEMVKFLVERGADVNLMTIGTMSVPLRYAVMTRDINIVKYLLDHGADVNARNIEGYTVLKIFNDVVTDIPITRLLIEYGSDWRVLVGKPILKQLITEDTKKLREELNQTLQVFKQVYYKEGHKVDTYLLIRLAYEKIYSELCHVTPREFPPLKLLALALVLDKDYKIEIKESWSELCQRVSKQVTDPKYYPPVKQYTPDNIPEDINNNNNL